MIKSTINCDKCKEQINNPEAHIRLELSVAARPSGTGNSKYDLCSTCRGWIENAISFNK